MSELDLFNLARAITAVEIGYFTQMITINFAMIVAIYYFLNQANVVMKISRLACTNGALRSAAVNSRTFFPVTMFMVTALSPTSRQ